MPTFVRSAIAGQRVRPRERPSLRHQMLDRRGIAALASAEADTVAPSGGTILAPQRPARFAAAASRTSAGSGLYQAVAGVRRAWRQSYLKKVAAAARTK